MPRSSFLLIIAWALAILPSYTAIANEVRYFYDDTGRLTRAIAGLDAAIYQYDEVGNLLSITRGAINSAPPLLESVTPDVLFTGATSQIIITGQNLLTTSSIISNNTSLTIRVAAVTDTTIKLSITAAPDSALGSATLTITTLFGTANIGVTLAKLTLSPHYLALTQGSSGTIETSILPAVNKDITIVLNNSDSTVTQVPPSVVIPQSGTATFTVDALQDGTTVISTVGTNAAGVPVFVTPPFSLLPGESVTSMGMPVSVFIQPSTPVAATVVANPVSISIQPSTIIEAANVAIPISVSVLPSTSVEAISSARPVSIRFSPFLAVDAISVTLPISVCIGQTSSFDATIVSAPVSVQLSLP